MPIIRPELNRVKDVLSKAGLLDEEAGKNEGKSVEDRFNQVGLTNKAVAEQMKDIALHSNNEALKLRALETILKVKGAMKDANALSIPTFNIIIQNSSANLDRTGGANPIFFPRQSLEGVTNANKTIDVRIEDGEEEEC